MFRNLCDRISCVIYFCVSCPDRYQHDLYTQRRDKSKAEQLFSSAVVISCQQTAHAVVFNCYKWLGRALRHFASIKF